MKSRALVCLGLTTAALVAYAGSFSGGFTLDSKPLILEDPRLKDASAENIDLILGHTYWWPHGEAGLYRPLTTLSYLFNYAVLENQDHPQGYHWLNFLLHAGNVLLVFLLASRLMRRLWPAAFAALLWAVHPLLTESVTNIVGRADLLSATALLGGLLLYVKSTEAAGSRRAVYLAGLAVVTAAGVFSKETGVVMPGLIVLYELVFRRGRKAIRDAIAGCLATLIPIGWMLYQRAQVLSASSPAAFPFLDNPIVGQGFWAGKLTALEVMGRYLLLFLWPAKLSTDYSYAQIPPASGVAEWLTAAAVLAVVAALLWIFRANRSVLFWAGFSFVTLLPASNLLFPTGAIMAERFLYLPAAGMAVIVVTAAYGASERAGMQRAALVVLSIAAIPLAARTWVRNGDWRDDVTLASSAVRSCPRSFKAHKTLAAALLSADPQHTNIDAVIGEAQQSVALLQGLPDRINDAAAYRLAGAAYLLKDNRAADEKALPLLLDCARIAEADEHAQHPNPNDDVYRLLSLDYLRLGNAPEALAQAKKAQAHEPMEAEAYRQLASSLSANAQRDEAAVALMEGFLLTQDQSLRQSVVQLYQEGLDTKGCATVAGPNGPALNPSCEVVRRHLCKAAAEAARTSQQAGRQDIAGTLQQNILQLGCAAGE